jgi:hypothetical protein
MSGALMLSLWPAFLKAPEGFGVMIPGGFSYRWH